MNIPNNYDAMLPMGGWTHLMLEWTKRFPHNAEALRPDANLHEVDRWAHLMTGTPHLLPRVDAHTTTHTHRHAIETRRSIRTYRQQALSDVQLGQVLHLLYPTTSHQISGQYERAFATNGNSEFCKLAVLVNDVAQVSPGAYLYDDKGHGLYPLRAEPPGTFLETICTQREFLQAPVILVMGGALPVALARYGERGYRYVLMEMGTLLAKLYFIVGAMGLGGSISGSFIFRDLERWLGYDGIHQTIAATFVFGQLPQAMHKEECP